VPTQPTFDDLISAAIQTESSGRANARGKAGELGLMQIKPETARDYGIKDPRLLLDPRINKAVGSRLLSDLLKKYHGDVRKALEAYNAGRGRVDKGKIPASALTYADKVLGRVGTGDSPSRPASSPQPAFSSNMMLAAPVSSGGSAKSGESLRDRLMRIFSPASASAADTLEIPRVGPPATRGVPVPPGVTMGAPAKRAVPVPPGVTMKPPPAPAKIGASGLGLPIPPGAVVGGASARKGTVPIPPGAIIGTKPSPSLPLAVRAADWLPTVGQIGGEMGGGALGIESGPGDIAAIGAGGGLGEGLGAEADTGVRALYGLPHKSQPQLRKEAIEAGAISGGGALITPALKIIAPSKLKAAIEASRAYKAAGTAADDVTTKLRQLLGMDADTALQTTLSPQAKADLAAAYAGARRAGFDQISKVYQDVLGPYFHRMTPNASAKAFNNFSSRYGAQSVGLLEGGVDFTRPTVRMIQQFRSNVAKAIARANLDRDRALIGDLARLRNTADADIKAVLPADRALRYDRINAARADFSSQMPGQKLRAMWNAPSSNKAVEEILKSDPRQVATLLRNIDQLPVRDRVKALTSLKDATSAWIYRQAANIPKSEGQAAALKAFGKAVHDVPDAAFARLYGGGAKQRMESAVDATLRFHEKMLRYPSLAMAVTAEVRARPMPWIVKHAHYASFYALYPLIRGNPEEAALALAIGFTPIGLHGLLDNPAMQALYIRALTAKDPKAIADGIRSLLTALAAQELREPMPEAPTPTPAGAPPPGRTPTGMPAPGSRPSGMPGMLP